jgi:hypothetical protein
MPMNNALVPLAPAREEPALPSGRRANADFVAHLIATAAGLPQTRARRRAEPQHALAVYRALGQWPTEPGRALSRSL